MQSLPQGTYTFVIQQTARRVDGGVTIELKAVPPFPAECSPFAYIDLFDTHLEEVARAARRWPLDPAVGLSHAVVSADVEHEPSPSGFPVVRLRRFRPVPGA